MTTVRVALAGCGRLGREVCLPTLGSIDGVQVAAIADEDPEALSRASSLVPTARASRHWRDTVAREDVDAVIVALPTALHAEAAIAVIESGKALYLEKPLAATAGDGRRVLAAHAAHPVVAMVGFNYRFNPLIQSLRARVHAGAVGAPRLFRSTFSTRAVPTSAWRAPGAAGGGVLLDLATHHVDLVRYILDDEIRRVSATVATRDDGAETAGVELETVRGTLVQSAFATGTVDDDRVEITGEAGQLAADRYRSVAVAYRPPAVASRVASLAAAMGRARHLTYVWQKRTACWHEPSYRLALAHFVDRIRRGMAPLPGLADGWAALAAVLAAREAAGRGSPVAPESLETLSDERF